MATFNEPGHQCPVDFGSDFGYGIGFEGSPGEPASNVSPPEGYEIADINVNGFATGRKVNNLDSFKSESQTTEETIQVSVEANSSGSGNVFVIDGIQRKSLKNNSYPPCCW